MKKTMSGLILRVSQCLCAAASLATMVSAPKFFDFTAFCFLITSMAIQVLWSSVFICLNIYALRKKTDLRNHILVNFFVFGDWMTATLSLAAACSSAGVIVLYTRDFDLCKLLPHHACIRFQVSIGLAFVSWFLMAISSHVMFWLLASV